jgi:hypothetical protein
MSPFGSTTDTNKTDRQIREASEKQLEQWAAADSNPDNQRLAMDALRNRKANRDSIEDARQGATQLALFDPRTEVSADARYIAGRIIKHLWIVFVLLPVIAVVILVLTGAIK